MRPLDPRRIQLDRVVGAVVGGVVSLMHLFSALILWLARGPRLDNGLALAAWLPITAVLAWLALRWPVIDYKHRRYRVDEDGIEIWSGVVWRRAIIVPKSRVQHIDVSQGPFERSYGLATLSLYTAGSAFSRVDLPGLDHGVALAIRDALLPRDAEPAV